MKATTVFSAYLLVAAFPILAQAQKFVPIDSNGKATEVTLTAEEIKGLGASKSVVFYATEKGNVPSHFDLQVGANVSVTATLSVKAVKGGVSGQRAIENKAGWTLQKVLVDGKAKKSLTISVGNSSSGGGSGDSGSGASGGDRDPACGCMTEAQIQAILDMIRKGGMDVTRDQYCEEVSGGVSLGTCDGSDPANGGSGGGGGAASNPDLTYAAGAGLIQKNACLSASTYTYIYRIEAQISGDDQALANGGKLSASMNLSHYDGDKRATLKISGGSKFPGAILLARIIGYYPQDKVEILNFRGTTLQSSSLLTRGDVMSYGGASYWRKAVNAYMRGGRATFQVSNAGTQGYNFCARLSVPPRQNFNGYVHD